jgi:hypothetical protein
MKHNRPINGFFDWIDQFAANASAKVFEPIINTYVGAAVNITGGVGKGLGEWAGNPDNIDTLIKTGIATQTGGLVGLGGSGSGSGSNEYQNENDYQSNSEKNTKIAKYILGGVAILGVGYLIVKDK